MKKKIIKHFKNNFAIYAVIVVCAVVVAITLFITHEDEVKTVDKSMFIELNLQQTLKLFDDDSPKLLVISIDTCSATINYVPYLQIAQAKYGFQTYYFNLDTIDSSQLDDYYKLVEKLDFQYLFQGRTDDFGKFIGSTPMTVFIKNKKQVYGYIGSMNDTTLGTLTKQYGIATKEYEG